MKKLKLMIVSALAAVAVSFGFAFAPVTVFAEEGAEMPKISIESVTSEEVIEETENVENSAIDKPTESVKEETKITLDDILEFAGALAENEGYGDEWEKALYYIETAASEKKVELMIFFVAAVFVFLLVDRTVKVIRWYKKRKADTTATDIAKIKSGITDVEKINNQQTNAINGLIDEEEKLVEKLAQVSVLEKVMSEALEKQNIAIRCLIRGTQIKQDLKDEAFRALNESDDLCDKAKK